jgi:hypothetical protein
VIEGFSELALEPLLSHKECSLIAGLRKPAECSR